MNVCLSYTACLCSHNALQKSTQNRACNLPECCSDKQADSNIVSPLLHLWMFACHTLLVCAATSALQKSPQNRARNLPGYGALRFESYSSYPPCKLESGLFVVPVCLRMFGVCNFAPNDPGFGISRPLFRREPNTR
ncbi:hypothetical protein ABBQ38_009727 [Trebouxia sp. C0009 RCD-2024]